MGAAACPATTSPAPVHSYRVHFATYGDRDFRRSKERIAREAGLTGWFDNVRAFGPEDLSKHFVRRHRSILSLKRGGGYWIWKLDVLRQMINSMDEGDVMVYADSGCRINRGGAPQFWAYADALAGSRHGMLSFVLKYPERMYTTDAIFEAFNVTDASITESPQFMATVMMVQKGPQQRRWLELVDRVMQQDPWIITDLYNRLTHRRGFRDNRHDQSIFSVSRKIVGSVAVKDSTWPPTQCDMPFWASRIKKFCFIFCT